MTSTERLDIQSLRLQRTAIKAEITRIIKFLNDVPDTPVVSLKGRKKKLEHLFDSFAETQLVLELMQPENKSNSFEFRQFEQQYFVAAKSIISRLEKFSRLRKIEFNGNVFNGNRFRWNSFHDTFNLFVHQRKDLTELQKLIVLEQSLCGDAAAVIAPLAIVKENYSVAWNLLKEKYDKPIKSINAHLQHLIGLPAVKSDSPSKLKNLAAEAESHVNSLKALKQPTQHWNLILICIIVNKLDKKMQHAWERSLKDDEIPKFSQLIAFINQQATKDTLEKIDSLKLDDTRRKSLNGGLPSFPTQAQQECIICMEEHSIYRCPSFLQLTVTNRILTARKFNLCINCLRSKHSVVNCRSPPCHICGELHHKFLHC